MDYESRFQSRRVYSDRMSFERKASRLALYALVGLTCFKLGFEAGMPLNYEEIEQRRIDRERAYERTLKDINYFLGNSK